MLLGKAPLSARLGRKLLQGEGVSADLLSSSKLPHTKYGINSDLATAAEVPLLQFVVTDVNKVHTRHMYMYIVLLGKALYAATLGRKLMLQQGVPGSLLSSSKLRQRENFITTPAVTE